MSFWSEVHSVNIGMGYPLLDIATPEEVIEHEGA